MCGEEVNTYSVSVGIPEGKISHRWPRPRCDGNNIKMDLRSNKMEGHGLGKGQMVGSCELGIEPSVLI
jgi:hypothetical protein